MTYKKQNWVKYGRGGRTCSLEIKDEEGKILDKARWLISDKDSERRIFTIFKNQWGVFKKPKFSEEIIPK